MTRKVPLYIEVSGGRGGRVRGRGWGSDKTVNGSKRGPKGSLLAYLEEPICSTSFFGLGLYTVQKRLPIQRQNDIQSVY